MIGAKKREKKITNRFGSKAMTNWKLNIMNNAQYFHYFRFHRFELANKNSLYITKDRSILKISLFLYYGGEEWNGKIFDFKIRTVPGNMLMGHGSLYFYLLMHANTNLYNIQKLFFLILLGIKLYVQLLFDLTFLFIKMAFIYPASVSNIIIFVFYFIFLFLFIKLSCNCSIH